MFFPAGPNKNLLTLHYYAGIRSRTRGSRYWNRSYAEKSHTRRKQKTRASRKFIEGLGHRLCKYVKVEPTQRRPRIKLSKAIYTRPRLGKAFMKFRSYVLTWHLSECVEWSYIAKFVLYLHWFGVLMLCVFSWVSRLCLSEWEWVNGHQNLNKSCLYLTSVTFHLLLFSLDHSTAGQKVLPLLQVLPNQVQCGLLVL